MIDDVLDGGGGVVISGFRSCWMACVFVGAAIEMTVGDGATDAFGEQDERQGDLGPPGVRRKSDLNQKGGASR